MSDPEFEALLDKMAEEMESEEDETPVEAHRWKVERKAMFDCDDSKYRCSKCNSRLTVRMDQSIAAAMEEQEVLRNCAEQLVQDVDAF